MNTVVNKENSFIRAMSGLLGVNKRSSDVVTSSNFWSQFGFGATTTAGKKITTHTALKLSAVYCAVEVLSNSVASLPVTIEKLEGSNRETLTNHPLASLLADQVNSYLTSFQFRKIMMRSLLLRGNAYALIVRDPRTGNTLRLQYCDPSEVAVRHLRATDEIVYTYRGTAYLSSDIIHLKINSDMGIVGRSVLTYAADNMGVSLSAMEFGSTTYENKGMTQGVIETDKQMNGQDGTDPKAAIARGFRGQMQVQDPYRVVVLDEGMKYKPITIKPEESQFLEAYKGGIQDIARWFNVPPHLLMDLTNANYSNMYQMDLSFLQRGVLPYVIQHEKEYSLKLLSFRESEENTRVNFDENALLRTDPKTKGEYLRAMVLSGLWSQNEGRVESGKNAKEGEQYDALLQPVNMQNQQQVEKNLKDE